MESLNDLKRQVRASRLQRNGDARRIREQANLSRSAVAEPIGVHPTTLGRWESGECSPRPAHAERWEAVLAAIVEEL